MGGYPTIIRVTIACVKDYSTRFAPSLFLRCARPRRPSARALEGIALAAPLALAALLPACGGDDATQTTTPPKVNLPEGCDLGLDKPSGGHDTTALQTALIEAKEGNTVCILAGTYKFTTELSLSVNKVTIKGDGQDKTILEFSGQTVGANGLNITSDGVTVTEFTMKNTPGDGIRASDVTDIHYKNVSVIWDAAASKENGAYGFYPVGSTNVRIEGCTVAGARDAGIYVGQSKNILVADCEAYGNVAGIEIENSSDAEVRNNHAHDNTGGILVFNLPNLPVQDGRRANVHDNIIENNNLPNFAAAGTTVAMVPSGTGLMVLAADDNEFHKNTISGNGSLGALIFSYSEPVFPKADDAKFNKYPQGNWFHDNTFTNNGTDPKDLVKQFIPKNPVPEFVWDGCEEAGVDNSTGKYTNCLSDNGAATYLNMACLEGPTDSDISKVTCDHTALPPQNP